MVKTQTDQFCTFNLGLCAGSQQGQSPSLTKNFDFLGQQKHTRTNYKCQYTDGLWRKT